MLRELIDRKIADFDHKHSPFIDLPDTDDIRDCEFEPELDIPWTNSTVESLLSQIEELLVHTSILLWLGMGLTALIWH